MSAYLMSLIPDVGCDDKHIPEYIRSRGKDKRSFSGIVVYATIDRGAIVRVQEYRTGVLWRGVYIPSGQGTYVDRCMKACEIMKGVTLMSKRNIHTRSGEDDWSDEYEDWYDEHPIESDPWWVGHFEEVGFGVYTDGEGHYYLDNDGDGLIDEETIAPGYVEDEEPENPDPPDPKPDPKPDPGTGDGNDDELPKGDGNVSNEPVINNSIVSAQKMFTASQYSVNRITELYGPIKAYCNQGVIVAFNQVFPDLHLPIVCANDLVRYWQQHPKG